MRKRFALGDVVRVDAELECCAGKIVTLYGVIVRLPLRKHVGKNEPWYADQYYRVRISTNSFTDFVEVSAKRKELSPAPGAELIV